MKESKIIKSNAKNTVYIDYQLSIWLINEAA